MSLWIYLSVAIVALLAVGIVYWIGKGLLWAGALSACLLFLGAVYVFTQSILLTLIPLVVLVMMAGVIIYFKRKTGGGLDQPTDVKWSLE